MNYVYTIQELELVRGSEVWRIIYEGPAESRAAEIFARAARALDVESTGYKISRDDQVKAELPAGSSERQVKRAFYDQVQELNARGKRAGTVQLVARDRWSRAVSYAVRPFEERLLGGDPQLARMRNQFSEPS